MQSGGRDVIGPAGVILAGGAARRMGGRDKALLRLGGQSLAARCAARLGPQVAALALNAADAGADLSALGLPVVPDAGAVRLGPLAGILAGLDWAAGLGAERLVSVAVDTPFFPDDLVAVLARAADAAGAPAAVACCGGRVHPAFGLWQVRLRAPLRAALADGVRRLGGWADDVGAVRAGFAMATPDPFFNINTPQDLALAEAATAAAGR